MSKLLLKQFNDVLLFQHSEVAVAAVAPEVVWQVGRPPYQSEIWYGGAIPIRDAGISLVLIPKARYSKLLLSFYVFINYFY